MGPVLLAVKLLVTAADPRQQELAGDLVEVEVAAALAADELRLALEPLERTLAEGRRDVLILARPLDQVLGRHDVARAGRSDHLAQQRDRCAPQVGREGVERLAQVVLEEPLRALGGEKSLWVVGLP